MPGHMSGSMHIIDLVTSDHDQKYAPAGRMASAIIEITYEQGGCLPQDLNARGFLPDDVLKYWHMANALAIVEMKLLCERSTKLKSIIRGK